MNIRRDHSSQRGITFIEGIILLFLLVIFVALLLPGHYCDTVQYKRRVLETVARAMVSEVGIVLNEHEVGHAMVFLNSPNTQVCYQSQNISDGNDCAKQYSDINEIVVYEGIGEILDAVAVHHNLGKEEYSPYDGEGLVNATSEESLGHVTIYSPDGSSVIIKAWDMDGNLLYKGTADVSYDDMKKGVRGSD